MLSPHGAGVCQPTRSREGAGREPGSGHSKRRPRLLGWARAASRWGGWGGSAGQRRTLDVSAASRDAATPGIGALDAYAGAACPPESRRGVRALGRVAEQRGARVGRAGGAGLGRSRVAACGSK